MYEFQHDYVKPKQHKKSKLCFMVKTDDIYRDIAEDAVTRFDFLNYELNRRLPKGKNEELI